MISHVTLSLSVPSLKSGWVAMAIFSKPVPRSPLVVVVVAVVLLLRSRLISLPKQTLRKLSTVTLSERLSKQELADALQQVYLREEDGSKTLLIPYRDRLSKVGFSTARTFLVHLFTTR